MLVKTSTTEDGTRHTRKNSINTSGKKLLAILEGVPGGELGPTHTSASWRPNPWPTLDDATAGRLSTETASPD